MILVYYLPGFLIVKPSLQHYSHWESHRLVFSLGEVTRNAVHNGHQLRRRDCNMYRHMYAKSPCVGTRTVCQSITDRIVRLAHLHGWDYVTPRINGTDDLSALRGTGTEMITAVGLAFHSVHVRSFC